MSMQMQLVMATPAEADAIDEDADFDDLAAVFEQPGSVDLDKAWDAVQSLFVEANPLFEGDSITGDVGYGPVRYVNPGRVREIASLVAATDQRELLARFDPTALAERAAYPDIWDRPDDVDYYRSEAVSGAQQVIDLYKRASETDAGVLIVLW